MENYASNSNKSKKEEVSKPKIEKIVSGGVKEKKKNSIEKFKDVLIQEDAKKVKSYIFMDVLVPALKKAISDIVSNGINMILYGEGGRPKNGGSSYIGSSKVSYSGYYTKKEEPRASSKTGSDDYRELIFDNKSEAEIVLSHLEELISVYKVASVADLYDLVGLAGRFTDNKYGWTDVSSARVISVPDGYMLKMPRALPID